MLTYVTVVYKLGKFFLHETASVKTNFDPEVDEFGVGEAGGDLVGGKPHWQLGLLNPLVHARQCALANFRLLIYSM